MHRTRLLCGIVACAACVSWGLPNAHTLAQSEPPSDAIPAYDGFINQALQAYDAGRFAEARTLFRRAHDLMPTARTLRTIGMCAFNLGDYVDAVASLEAALSDTRKPLTDEQRRHASDLIARSNQHVGRFRLRLSPPEAALTVDGRAPTLIGSQELLLESGRHEIDVRAVGFRPAQSVLSVDGGDRTTLELRLMPGSDTAVAQSMEAIKGQPSAAVVAGPHAPTAATTATYDDSQQGSLQKTLGYVTLGVGAAGLIGFGVVSGLAIAKKGTLDDHCPSAQCPPAYHGDVDTYDRLKTASTALLIGGGVFALVGAGLLLFPGQHATEHAAIQPLFGLGAVGVRGQL